MNLTPRLEAMYLLVDNGEKTVDVGCDHAYLSIELIKRGKSDFAIAVDNKIGPLESARRNIKNANLEDKIELILSDGLKNVHSKYDTVLMSGLGGELIKSILENGPLNRSASLILEPNNSSDVVRRFLMDNSYEIVNEMIVREKDRFYELIKAIPSSKIIPLDEYEIFFGPINLKRKENEFINYINKNIDIFRKKAGSGPIPKSLDEKIKFYEGAISYVKSETNL